MTSATDVLVVGGGIAGLACAHFLQQHGFRPTVWEASERLGGLGSSFEHEGVRLDRFYHVILESDVELCSLISELNLDDQLVWRQTGLGFHVDGTLYPFNCAADVLRFAPLSWSDRVRTGAGAWFITQSRPRLETLDAIPLRDWLHRLFGRRVYQRVWEPLLRAKFGDDGPAVPALWLWHLLNREKQGGPEIKGYLRGGYETLTCAIAQAITRAGGTIHQHTPVRRLVVDEARVIAESDVRRATFAAVVSTLPLPQLARVVSGPVRGELPLGDLRYQGVVNVLLLSRRPLDRFYWTVVLHPDIQFQGVVETTHVIPTEWVGGYHLAYLMNYCAADSDTYHRSDDEMTQQAQAAVHRLYPHYRDSDCVGAYVFRAPYVEPVWSTGYLRRRPPCRVGNTRLFLCTTAQAYPRVTAWNTSVALAAETVAALAQQLGAVRSIPASPQARRSSYADTVSLPSP